MSDQVFPVLVIWEAIEMDCVAYVGFYEMSVMWIICTKQAIGLELMFQTPESNTPLNLFKKYVFIKLFLIMLYYMIDV